MTGLYFVAARLSRREFVLGSTPQSAYGDDRHASTLSATRVLAIEAKINARAHSS